MGIFTSKREIGLDTILRREGNVLYNIIDNEVVILSAEHSEYYGLDKVASRIWTLLEKPIRFEDLVCKLMYEYEVSNEKCIEDTIEFINKLKNKNLIICD